MSSNGNGQFREDELVTRRMKVNGEWQSRTFPVVGGRLRLAHESNQSLSLETEMVQWDGQYAVFRCKAVTDKGQFVGYGTANGQRDARLSESLIELAETRSIARALRFSGYGMEFCGAEEVSHVDAAESFREQTVDKSDERVFPENDDRGKPEAKPPRSGNGRATSAQCRALYALTKKANYAPEDVDSMLRPFNATSFDELTREDASRLITGLQTEVAA